MDVKHAQISEGMQFNNRGLAFLLREWKNIFVNSDAYNVRFVTSCKKRPELTSRMVEDIRRIASVIAVAMVVAMVTAETRAQV